MKSSESWFSSTALIFGEGKEKKREREKEIYCFGTRINKD